MLRPVMLKELKWNGSMKTTRPSRTNTQKKRSFVIGYWNAKVGSQETPGVTGKLGFGVQMKQGKN